MKPLQGFVTCFNSFNYQGLDDVRNKFIVLHNKQVIYLNLVKNTPHLVKT